MSFSAASLMYASSFGPTLMTCFSNLTRLLLLEGEGEGTYWAVSVVDFGDFVDFYAEEAVVCVHERCCCP